MKVKGIAECSKELNEGHKYCRMLPLEPWIILQYF